MPSEIFRFNAKLRLRLLKIGFVEQSSYKLATLFNFFVTFIYITVQYFLWGAIYKSTASVNINQYSFSDIFVYICLSQLINLIFPSYISGRFSEFVRNGDIIHVLLKPVSIETQLFYESIGRGLYRFLTNAFPTFLVISFFVVQIPQISISTLLKFLVIFSLSFIFMFYFEMLLGIISFYTLSIWGIQSLKYVIIAILSGRIMPISLYPKPFRKLVDLLPFKIVYFEPIVFLMGKSDLGFLYILGYQAMSIFFLCLLYKFIYNIVIKRLTIQGG